MLLIVLYMISFLSIPYGDFLLINPDGAYIFRPLFRL